MTNKELKVIAHQHAISILGKDHKKDKAALKVIEDVYIAGAKAILDSSKDDSDKAKKWDKLGEKIGACYVNEDGSENYDEDCDLCAIGEMAAMAFGFL